MTVPEDDMPLTIGALLERRVREHGDERYVVTPTARLTFAEAERRSALPALIAARTGRGKGARVGLLFFTSDEQWVLWWAGRDADRRTSRSDEHHVCPGRDCQNPPIGRCRVAGRSRDSSENRCRRGVRGGSARPAGPAAQPYPTGRCPLPMAHRRRRTVRSAPWATPWEREDRLVSTELLKAAEAQVFPSDLAIMVHTSGSTADPKGVLITHGTLARQTSSWPVAIRAIASRGRTAASALRDAVLLDRRDPRRHGRVTWTGHVAGATPVGRRSRLGPGRTRTCARGGRVAGVHPEDAAAFFVPRPGSHHRTAAVRRARRSGDDRCAGWPSGSSDDDRDWWPRTPTSRSWTATVVRFRTALSASYSFAVSA